MTNMPDIPVHTFPDRGAGEWVAYADYVALLARAEKADRQRDEWKGYHILVSSKCIDLQSERDEAIRCALMRRDRLDEVERKNDDLQSRAEKAEAERDTLRAENELLMAAQAWQPIETAPKDGTEFIACLNYGENQEFAVMIWHECEEDWTDTFGAIIGLPTHWMPSPTPPTP